ncbi:MAG TPA: sulfatase [Candidatus Brocadiia bacterium]|nr:sulfatase [Candidatus Brocadiia bacterium]
MADCSRREMLRNGLAGLGGYCLLNRFAGLDALAAPDGGRLNVLFIAVDDLRPELGCYGNRIVKSPSIDALAASGMTFKRAYCQQAVCSPSRTSLLTGRRPDTTLVYDLNTHFRRHIPDVVTLPQHFVSNGYHAQSFGKIFHGGFDDPASWTEPAWFPEAPQYGKPENIALMEKNAAEAREFNKKLKGGVALEKDPKTGIILKENPRKKKARRGPSWEDPDAPDHALPDGRITDAALNAMRRIKDKPFFLAVGFLKPHLPFVAPKKYFDLYKGIDIPLADNPFAPRNAPQFALSNWGELRQYNDIPGEGPLSDDKARELVRAYYAAVSFTDAQIGRLLAGLDALGLREKTVVVLWGDHGWQLGEHGMWCKHTNFETSVHSPLVISAPGRKNAGGASDALVEFVDIYPSLCEACGLQPPAGLEGASFIPLLENPAREWKRAAFSQYPRSIPNVGDCMGYSMRTDRYRFTEWAVPEKGFRVCELYDHSTDPDENENIADKPENAELVKELTKTLREGWRGAMPKG